MRANLIHHRRQAGWPGCGKPRPAAPSRGFSLVELMLVAAIAVVLMAIAIPNFVNTLTLAKLRGGMSDLSGIFQSCRSQAIKLNSTKELLFTTSNGQWLIYVDDLASPQGLTPAPPLSPPPQVWLPAQFTKVTAPASSSTNPAPLNASTMWGGSSTTPPDTSDNLCFNSRGIPCACPNTTPNYCAGITNGYAFYFTQGTQWAALAVSPAGRIKTYFWNGSAWSN
jgi:prepilin-type N-terminal cleavage/methylation domain-containing protein